MCGSVVCASVCAWRRHGRPISVVTGAWGNALTLSFVSCCGVFSDVRCNVLRVLNRLFVVCVLNRLLPRAAIELEQEPGPARVRFVGVVAGGGDGIVRIVVLRVKPA